MFKIYKWVIVDRVFDRNIPNVFSSTSFVNVSIKVSPHPSLNTLKAII